ncbi:hypothetical protein AAE478_000642 [Parahypoxylon ruwenzoriense]
MFAAAAAIGHLSASLITQPRADRAKRQRQRRELVVPSPRTMTLGEETATDLPYPPDALPGGRDVATPYGSIRVYEWGPEDGERVLLVHGISTPAVALGDLAHELSGRGYRVMLFDLFGRGYSDAPSDLPYDSRLYASQILLVLASSSVPWATPATTAASTGGFHLIGYSLGGGLSVAFTRYLPHLVRSLTLIASCGHIRSHHVGWQSRLLYNSDLLPEFLVEWLVRRRIRPQVSTGTGRPRHREQGAADDVAIAAAETTKLKRLPNGDGDANGGDGFDSAAISKFRPGVTVASVVRWQVDRHAGFVGAFLSTIRNAPIYAPQEDWEELAVILGARRPKREGELADKPSESESESESPIPGLHAGKILIVLGEDDPVIVKDETVEDAGKVLGPDGVEFAVLPGGHELPITSSFSVANTLEGFWRR